MESDSDQGKGMVVKLSQNKSLETLSPREIEIQKAQEALRPATVEQIAAVLAGLTAVYGAPDGWEIGAKLYVEVLDDLPYDVLVGAVNEHLKTSKWFPKPSEIREFASNSMYYLKANLADAKRDYDGAHKAPWW